MNIGYNEKHNLHIFPQQGCREPALQHLAGLVEDTRGILLPFCKQIFKGKSLKAMQQPLSGLGMQNGCWVMITETKGERVDLKKLNDREKCVEKTAD